MKEKILGLYRTFLHKMLYVSGYSKKVIIITIILLIIDLVVLYLVW